MATINDYYYTSATGGTVVRTTNIGGLDFGSNNSDGSNHTAAQTGTFYIGDLESADAGGVVVQAAFYEGALSATEIDAVAQQMFDNPSAVIPEPASMVLLGVSGLLILCRRYRI